MVEILFWGAGGIVFSKDEGEGGTEIVLCALLQRVLPSTLTEFLPWDSARKDDQLSLKWRVQILRLMMNNRVIYVHIGRFIEKHQVKQNFTFLRSCLGTEMKTSSSLSMFESCL